jgi:hypothetical protein
MAKIKLTRDFKEFLQLLNSETIDYLLPPNQLELLTAIAGVSFDECYPKRQMMDVEGLEVPVISYEDLKQNKLASGRLRDKADIETLEKSRTRKNN